MSNLPTTPTGTGANVIPVVQKGAVPLAPPVAGMQGLSVADRVVHEPEQIIRHEPIVEKEVLREPALEVKREHHIQPIIHETEHRIQPILKTEATTEQPIIQQEKNVMLQPVLERAPLPAGLEPVERVAPEGIIHAPKLERQVVSERPVEVRTEHHVQPIIHEREHVIQPIIKTEATAEQTHIRTDKNVMHAPILEREALPAGLEAVERAGPEGIIHKPKLAKDVVVEHPVQVKHERHIQPIIHEREHHIQPIVKTEVTAEETHLKTEKNVLLEPVLERAALPAGLEPVERAGPEGVVHRPIMEKEVLVEHPVQVKHERHIQPIIHEREHHIQPIVKTQVTAEQRLVETEHEVLLPPIVEPTVMVDRPAAPIAAPAVAPVLPAAQPAVTATTTLPRTAGLGTGLAPEPVVLPRSAGVVPPTGLGTAGAGMLDSEERLPSAAVPPPLAGEREVYNRGLGTGTGTGLGSSTGGTATFGQKIKGALKEVQGTITRNPAKKEEGKKLMQGVDPATGASTTGTGRTGL